VHSFNSSDNNTPLHDESTNIAAMDDATVSSHHYDTSNVSEAPRRLNVNISTLSKRFSGRTGSEAEADKKQ
jgi:hypothetical protein